jgi:phosphoglycerate dehydrogenase-like enzyme
MKVHVWGELTEEQQGVFEGLEVHFGEVVGADCEILVRGDEVDEGLGSLRVVVVPWAGVGGLVMKAAKARGLTVFNLHHNAGATAQTAVGLLLAVTRDVVGMDREFRAGSWRARFEGAETLDLTGLTAVVLGMGAIGTQVAAILRAMKMEVIGVARKERGDVWGIERLDEALERAEVCICCLPLTPETRGILDRKRLSLMPDGAVFVNVGRGAVVEERALFDELESGRFFGAGLDVWWKYPETAEDRVWPGECDWASLGNVVMTPHRGGTGVGEMARWRAVRAVLDRVLAGDMSGAVNLERGY